MLRGGSHFDFLPLLFLSLSLLSLSLSLSRSFTHTLSHYHSISHTHSLYLKHTHTSTLFLSFLSGFLFLFIILQSFPSILSVCLSRIQVHVFFLDTTRHTLNQNLLTFILPQVQPVTSWYVILFLFYQFYIQLLDYLILLKARHDEMMHESITLHDREYINICLFTCVSFFIWDLSLRLLQD